MFHYQVIYLDFNAVPSVREKVFPLTFRKSLDLLADTINFWIAAKQYEEDFRTAKEKV